MGLAKIYVLALLLVLANVIFCNADCLEMSWKYHEQCKDKKDRELCMFDPDHENSWTTTSPCYSECIGHPADPDQKKCWCDCCKKGHLGFESFCLGSSRLNETTDCDKYVCTREATYGGDCPGHRVITAAE